ncbi:LysE family translocator [Actinomadura citrea]|uniref:Threonine/homoserine/homoserine lactone efflux protein n=1 Tax=Actinomadura citrea TaxID=46158 RepID=A0A7Y9KFX7_9ACTN|nr:LysE family translocator [Actinomadura citrea]NYE17842.1 threonine/homoserine/homoserine lactone efflux protein [Actinomadura citrea]
MATGSVLAFWAVSLLLIAVPGADWAFTIGAGLRSGSVVPAVGGLVVGYAAVTVIVAAGVGALVAGSPSVLTGLTAVGGLYLIWHGATTFTRPSALDVRAGVGTDWSTFLRGIGVSGLNPKGLLIFLALLPQFTDPHYAWPVPVQLAVLGLTFMATCAAFYLCLGTLTRTVLDPRPAAARTVTRLSGAAMTALGTWLFLDHLLP